MHSKTIFTFIFIHSYACFSCFFLTPANTVWGSFIMVTRVSVKVSIWMHKNMTYRFNCRKKNCQVRGFLSYPRLGGIIPVLLCSFFRPNKKYIFVIIFLRNNYWQLLAFWCIQPELVVPYRISRFTPVKSYFLFTNTVHF